MKVVLLKDVAKIGKANEVKEVSNGYALNFLIPKKMAKTATTGNIKQAEQIKIELEAKKQIQKDLLLKNFGDVKDAKITISAKASDKGHLFSGIHKEEITKALKEQTGLDIEPDFIQLEHPVKEIGEHEIEVKVDDRKVKFILEIRDTR